LLECENQEDPQSKKKSITCRDTFAATRFYRRIYISE